MATHATPEHHARVAALTFAGVYPHYVTKVEKKGRSEAELLEVIEWLTGYTRQIWTAISPQNLRSKPFLTRLIFIPMPT